MIGSFQFPSNGWLVLVLTVGALIALWWWIRKSARHAHAAGDEALTSALTAEEGGADPAGTAQVLNEFFGVPQSTASERPLHAPRLTAHPLAQIIAHARVDPAPVTARSEPAVDSPEQPQPPPAGDAVEVALALAETAVPLPDPVQESSHPKDAELEQLQVELARMTARYKALDKEAFIHSAHNKQLEAEIADLRQGLVPPGGPTQEDIDRLKSELATTNDFLQQAKSENLALAEKIRAASALEGELASVRLDLAAAEELLHATESAKAEPPASPPVVQEPGVREDMSALQSEVESLRKVNEELRTDIAERKAAGPLQEPEPVVREDMSALQSEVESLRRVNEELRADIAERKAAGTLQEPEPVVREDMSALQSEVESLRRVNEELRADIAELKAAAAEQAVAATPVIPVGDDLTDIKGVAKVLNRKLNEQGIFTFRQIALLTEAEIATLSSALGLKNRISRDHWQTQARRLHAEKHGEVLPVMDAPVNLLPLSDFHPEASEGSAEG